ncbi:glucose 1-dehydrogenase [Halogeometricum sp. S1BR25-6]|uniref:Glucose 1-dehydrogenase n=1 Tax=Halogeometricum salsisoli TaxID=2950536 RepID=A0ABU2GJY6_9EURY|nr:glucose 1-dehydrogenase [Halogeometricum sp. S1BR25-6]MDS0301136.1 glucose 1-dehydrogenase [Halogeometricum sp. S1BR25-6]
MKAIAVERGSSQPTLLDVSEPIPDAGEALLRTLRVGIDGTDREVIQGNHGGYPVDDDYQILGHEAVAAVEDPNGTDLKAGQLVVPTVRRPSVETDVDGGEYFERGEPDMAPDGAYVERGIVGAHGYMSEFFVSSPEFLVPVPDSYAEYGFLVEPISNSEKAFEHAFAARSAFEWTPESALVLGNGPLGLLTLAMLETDTSPFERNYCLGRRDRPDPSIDIIERLGGTYVDSRETPVDRVAEAFEPMDFVYEATGYAKHAFQTVDALAPNGVGALLGIPNDWAFEVDGGRLHRELVLENKALFGSVNSNIGQYEAARERLSEFPDWFLDAFVTGVYAPQEVESAFETGEDVIKTVVEFDTP